MNNLPRQMLRRIIGKHGKEIAGNAERCRALLNDSCGAYRREINVLVEAVEERVPLDLLAAARSMPTELLLTRLEKRLADQTGLTAEAARWAVESWALALDVATDSEIAERALPPNQAARAARETIRSADDENKPVNQALPKISPLDDGTPPPPGKTSAPPPSPRTTSPINRQTPKFPAPPSLPATLPAPRQPASQTTTTANPFPGTPNQTVPRPSRSRLFRGCLVFVFLLIVSFAVLLFGVPYAFEAMRETQREKRNEPPRFPAR